MQKKTNFLVIYIAMSPTTNGQVWLSLMSVKAVDLAAVAADAGKIHVRDAEGQSSPADWPLGPRQLRHRVRGHSRRRTVYLSCHQLTGNRRGICRRPYARYASLVFNLTHYCIINWGVQCKNSTTTRNTSFQESEKRFLSLKLNKFTQASYYALKVCR